MSTLSNAVAIAEELRESLSEDAQECLREDLANLGWAGWNQWSVENRPEAMDYLQASPKQRARRKKWQEPVQRARLTLFAYHLARLALAALAVTNELLGAKGSRRDMAYAAEIASQVLDEASWHWPFEETEPPDGWPGPRYEFYYSGTVVVKPNGESEHLPPRYGWTPS